MTRKECALPTLLMVVENQDKENMREVRKGIAIRNGIYMIDSVTRRPATNLPTDNFPQHTLSLIF